MRPRVVFISKCQSFSLARTFAVGILASGSLLVACQDITLESVSVILSIDVRNSSSIAKWIEKDLEVTGTRAIIAKSRKIQICEDVCLWRADLR